MIDCVAPLACCEVSDSGSLASRRRRERRPTRHLLCSRLNASRLARVQCTHRDPNRQENAQSCHQHHLQRLRRRTTASPLPPPTWTIRSCSPTARSRRAANKPSARGWMQVAVLSSPPAGRRAASASGCHRACTAYPGFATMAPKFACTAKSSIVTSFPQQPWSTSSIASWRISPTPRWVSRLTICCGSTARAVASGSTLITGWGTCVRWRTCPPPRCCSSPSASMRCWRGWGRCRKACALCPPGATPSSNLWQMAPTR